MKFSVPSSALSPLRLSSRYFTNPRLLVLHCSGEKILQPVSFSSRKAAQRSPIPEHRKSSALRNDIAFVLPAMLLKRPRLWQSLVATTICNIACTFSLSSSHFIHPNHHFQTAVLHSIWRAHQGSVSYKEWLPPQALTINRPPQSHKGQEAIKHRHTEIGNRNPLVLLHHLCECSQQKCSCNGSMVHNLLEVISTRGQRDSWTDFTWPDGIWAGKIVFIVPFQNSVACFNHTLTGAQFKGVSLCKYKTSDLLPQFAYLW